MKDLLKVYEQKTPEIVFEWQDAETEAHGWVVINSLRGGAAGGGTRMRKGLDKREVESLAKTMEIKFSVSGPPIGGAKSGINFDPSDPRKKGVLERWFRAVLPLLRNYYGTGGDLNIDEIHEVIPITGNLGLEHPQEGVVTGHFKPDGTQKVKQIKQLQAGVSKVVEDVKYSPDPTQKFVVADLITGFGVAKSVSHFYDIYGGELQGKRAVIQGWGNVGSAAGYYLAQMGVKIVGIIDREGGLIKEEGFSFEEIRQLYLTKQNNTLSAPHLLSFQEMNERIWDLPAEIFLPCAASRLITKEQVDRMIGAGMEVIACGANVPFADPEIFFGPVMEYSDEKLNIIPDFVSNCGMARVFAYCMSPDAELSDEGIFEDTSATIKKALEEAHARRNEKLQIAASCFQNALTQLV